MTEVPKASSRNKNLTVVLSGGISLGAYHAGAVAQLGAFVSHWNSLVDAQQDDQVPKLFIDVVSGASAGSMTGAVLFTFLAKGSRPESVERFVAENYEIWTGDTLQFSSLLNPGSSQGKSFLSDSVIDDLAQKHLIQVSPDFGLGHGQRRLLFTCTLTSREPISFNIRLDDVAAPKSAFYGVTRRDWITFRIYRQGEFEMTEPGTSCSQGEWVFDELATEPREAQPQEVWARFGWAATTSGAFPFAWQPVKFDRYLAYYPEPFKGVTWQSQTAEMTYSDGGVIDNMPLDRAAKALRDCTKFSPNPGDLFDDRTYVLIECNPIEGKPAATPGSGQPPRRAESLGVQAVAGPLFDAVREQSFYTDLRRASQINERLNERAKVLWPFLERDVEASIETGGAEAELGSVLATLRDILQARRSRLSLEEKLKVYASREDVRGRTEGKSEAFRDLFAARALMLDLVADLEDKHVLQVMRVRPRRALYGQLLADFGGFLDPSYMKSDFVCGLEDAYETLCAFVKGLPGVSEDFTNIAFGPCRVDPEGYRPNGELQPPRRAPGEMKPYTLGDVPPDLRNSVVNLVLDRLGPWARSNFQGVVGTALVALARVVKALLDPWRKALLIGTLVLVLVLAVWGVVAVPLLLLRR